MKNILNISIITLLLFSCNNKPAVSNDPITIGTFKNDAGKVVPITIGEITNQQIWLDYIKAHNEKDLEKIAEINAENWEGYTADGSVAKK